MTRPRFLSEVETLWQTLAAGMLRSDPSVTIDDAARSARVAIQSALFQVLAEETGLACDDALPTILGRLRHSEIRNEILSRGPAVLGQVHEYLLGKSLQRIAGGLQVRSSMAARKAAGVFYTPDYVAEYIAAQAFRILADAEPELPAILDPACGCGQFLLAACRAMLHQDQPAARGISCLELAQHLHGRDLDPEAVLATRRTLLLEIAAKCNPDASEARDIAAALEYSIRCEDVLTVDSASDPQRFHLVLGNPPYRRELGTKALMDRVALTSLGQRYRAPRMDLWYYFLYAGLERLRPGGVLSFIVGSYWTAGRGAEKLIEAIRSSCQVEEIFLLDKLRVFPGVCGRHMILTLSKQPATRPARIKRPEVSEIRDAEPFVRGVAPVKTWHKPHDQLFRDGQLDLEPECEERWHACFARTVPLAQFGLIRQGIAENPATVTRKANERHCNRWRVGEGVFVLTGEELARLQLPEEELCLVRPYHDLCDVDRYWSAATPSRWLLYLTTRTCPEIDRFPAVREHLVRFCPLLEARRETRLGVRPWWQLHWPRDESLWRCPKILAVQMARRPAFAPAAGPAYVPFSINVFVPHAAAGLHLNFFAAVLNSSLACQWFRRNAKQRGVGLEINGHVLARFPFPAIDLAVSRHKDLHDRLAALVSDLLAATASARAAASGSKSQAEEACSELEAEIDRLVEEMYEAN